MSTKEPNPTVTDPPAAKQRETYITVEEAARRLVLKPVTVRAWAAARRFEYVKLNRTIRIPEREIDRIIAENTVPARDGHQEH